MKATDFAPYSDRFWFSRSRWAWKPLDVSATPGNYKALPPRGVSGKESACQCRRYKIGGFDLWAGKIPWRRKRQPTLVFLPGKSHGQRILVGYSPWGCKESDKTKHITLESVKFVVMLTCLSVDVTLDWQAPYEKSSTLTNTHKCQALGSTEPGK